MLIAALIMTIIALSSLLLVMHLRHSQECTEQSNTYAKITHLLEQERYKTKKLREQQYKLKKRMDTVPTIRL